MPEVQLATAGESILVRRKAAETLVWQVNEMYKRFKQSGHIDPTQLALTVEAAMVLNSDLRKVS